MSKVSTTKVSRRRLMLAGAGTAGAAAAVAAALPLVKPELSATPAKTAASDQAGGYQVTEHVLTYYRTARV